MKLKIPPDTHIVSRVKVYPILKGTHGKIFSCHFIKQDGTIRYLTGQVRPPKKNAKKPSPEKENNPYILVGDMQKYNELLAKGASRDAAYNGSYRLINIETIIDFKASGAHYVVKDALEWDSVVHEKGE